MVGGGPQLQPQGDEEAADPDDGGQRDAHHAQEVGARLADAGGEQLDHPEEEEDLGDLRDAEDSWVHGLQRADRRLTQHLNGRRIGG